MPDREDELLNKLLNITQNREVDSITPRVKEVLRHLPHLPSLTPIRDLLSKGLQPFDYFDQNEKAWLLKNDPSHKADAWNSFNTVQTLISDAAHTPAIDAKAKSLLLEIFELWKAFGKSLQEADNQNRALLLKQKATLLVNETHYYIDMNVARRLLGIDRYGFNAETESYGNSNTVRYSDMYFKPPEDEYFLDENYVYELCRCIEIPGESPLVARTYIELTGVSVDVVAAESIKTDKAREAFDRLNQAIFSGHSAERHLAKNSKDRLALPFVQRRKEAFLRVSLDAGKGFLLEEVFAAIDGYMLLKSQLPRDKLTEQATFTKLMASRPLEGLSDEATHLAHLTDDAFTHHAAELLFELIEKARPKKKSGSRRSSRNGSRIRKGKGSNVVEKPFSDVSSNRFSDKASIAEIFKQILDNSCRNRLEGLLAILLIFPGEFIFHGLSFYSLLNSVYALPVLSKLLPHASPNEIYRKVDHYLDKAWSPINRDHVITLSTLAGFSDMKADNVKLIPMGTHFKLVLFDYDAIATREFNYVHGEHYPLVRQVWPKFPNHFSHKFIFRFAEHISWLNLRGNYMRFLMELALFKESYSERLSLGQDYRLPYNLYQNLLDVRKLFVQKNSTATRQFVPENQLSPVEHCTLLQAHLSKAMQHYLVTLSGCSNSYLDFQRQLFDGKIVKSLEGLCPDLVADDLNSEETTATLSQTIQAFVEAAHDSEFSKAELGAVNELRTKAGLKHNRTIFGKKAWRRLTLSPPRESDPISSASSATLEPTQRRSSMPVSDSIEALAKPDAPRAVQSSRN